MSILSTFGIVIRFDFVDRALLARGIYHDSLVRAFKELCVPIQLHSKRANKTYSHCVSTCGAHTHTQRQTVQCSQIAMCSDITCNYSMNPRHISQCVLWTRGRNSMLSRRFFIIIRLTVGRWAEVLWLHSWLSVRVRKEGKKITGIRLMFVVHAFYKASPPNIKSFIDAGHFLCVCVCVAACISTNSTDFYCYSDYSLFLPSTKSAIA